MPTPKVILQLYPMMPTADRAERERRRPLGRDRALYHRIVHEWTEIVKEAEQMGVWGVSTIEHHLHSEGYEVGPTPGVLDAWWAAHTQRIKVGALGYVMATQDPIRVAEETAILDHLSEGRLFVGLARGYQSRWTNILGQFSDAVATVSDGSDEDQRNRAIFEERTEMLLRCWTEDSTSIKGRFYQIPYPYETGVRGYPGWRGARTAGAPGEIDAEGAVRRVSVVPAPYQTPHPPVFVALSASAESIPFCARHEFRPSYFTALAKAHELSNLYLKCAAEAGHRLKLGERQNLVRWPHFARSAREYDEQLIRYEIDIYQNFYSAFFRQMAPRQDVDWIQSIKDSGLYIGGTLEQAREEWLRSYELLPAEYITLIWHYAQFPKELVLSELKTFMDQVLPHLKAAA